MPWSYRSSRMGRRKAPAGSAATIDITTVHRRGKWARRTELFMSGSPQAPPSYFDDVLWALVVEWLFTGAPAWRTSVVEPVLATLLSFFFPFDCVATTAGRSSRRCSSCA